MATDVMVCANCAAMKPTDQFLNQANAGVKNEKCKECRSEHKRPHGPRKKQPRQYHPRGLGKVAVEDRATLVADVATLTTVEIATKYKVAARTADVWRRKVRNGIPLFGAVEDA